ncbi:MAG: twin transmembrane helix small protein [Pseudomonadota bacterium]
MSLTVQIISAIAVIAVAVVLIMGLGNMMKGGSANRSQQLMRWRVMLQGLAIVVVFIAAWFAGRT